MKKTIKKYQTGGPKVTAKPKVKTGTYKPDAVQKIKYKLAPLFGDTPEGARKTDSIIDSREMIRLKNKLGVKKSGGATYKKGGSIKKKK